MITRFFCRRQAPIRSPKQLKNFVWLQSTHLARPFLFFPMADAAEPFSVIPSEITSNLRLIQWTELSVLSSFMVLVYDYILTFDREVTSMWPSRWGFGKILFFLTRYFSLIVMGFVIAVMFWPSLTDDLYACLFYNMPRLDSMALDRRNNYCSFNRTDYDTTGLRYVWPEPENYHPSKH